MVQDNPESFADLDGHMNSAATASQTSLCDVTTGEGCTYEQRGYISVILRSPSEQGSHDKVALANKVNLLSPPGWPYAIAFHPLVSVAQCLKDIAACQQKSEHPSFFKMLEMSATMVACFQICPALQSGGAALAALGLLPDPPNPSSTQLKVQQGQTKIPQNVLDTLGHIDEHGVAPEGFEGGRAFRNREGRLPSADAHGNAISYREWDVNPQRAGQNRGPERLVTGSNGSAYYTPDHYGSFIPVRQ